MKRVYYLILVFIILFSINGIYALEIDNSSVYSTDSVEDNLKVESDLLSNNVNIDDQKNEINTEFNDIIKSDNNNSRIIYVGHHNTTDGGNGSFDNPFTTFKAACDDVHGENNISILVFGGTYYLGEGFTINNKTPLIFDTNNLNVIGINGSV